MILNTNHIPSSKHPGPYFKFYLKGVGIKVLTPHFKGWVLSYAAIGQKEKTDNTHTWTLQARGDWKSWNGKETIVYWKGYRSSCFSASKNQLCIVIGLLSIKKDVDHWPMSVGLIGQWDMVLTWRFAPKLGPMLRSDTPMVVVGCSVVLFGCSDVLVGWY